MFLQVANCSQSSPQDVGINPLACHRIEGYVGSIGTISTRRVEIEVMADLLPHVIQSGSVRKIELCATTEQ